MELKLLRFTIAIASFLCLILFVWRSGWNVRVLLGESSYSYRLAPNTEVVDDPPTGWAYSVHVKRTSDGGIEKIDVPNNAVVKRASDGWTIDVPHPVPRDLYDSNEYLPRGSHLHRSQFSNKQWAEKKLLEKFYRSDAGGKPDFEGHDFHSDVGSADDFPPQKASFETETKGSDCLDVDCYYERVNSHQPHPSRINVHKADDQLSPKCGVSCIVNFLADAVASKKPRPAQRLDSPEPEGALIQSSSVESKQTVLKGADSAHQHSNSGISSKGDIIKSEHKGIELERSNSGRISKIFIPDGATISHTSSGLVITLTSRSQNTLGSSSDGDSSRFHSSAAVDAYAPNVDPYYCEDGSMAAECGTGPHPHEHRHDYSLGWGPRSPTRGAQEQAGSNGAVPEQIRKDVSRVVKDLLQSLQDYAQRPPKIAAESPVVHQGVPVAEATEVKVRSVEHRSLQQGLAARNKRLLGAVRNEESQIRDLSFLRHSASREDRISEPGDRLAKGGQVESDRDSVLQRENEELSRRLRDDRQRLHGLERLLDMGQAQDRASAPLPPPRAQSLAMISRRGSAHLALAQPAGGGADQEPIADQASDRAQELAVDAAALKALEAQATARQLALEELEKEGSHTPPSPVPAAAVVTQPSAPASVSPAGAATAVQPATKLVQGIESWLQAYGRHVGLHREAATETEAPYVSMQHGHTMSLQAPARLSQLADIPADMMRPAASPAASSAPAARAAPGSVQGWLDQYAHVPLRNGAALVAAGGAAEGLERRLAAQEQAAAVEARRLRRLAGDPSRGAATDSIARAAAERLAQKAERLRMRTHSAEARRQARRTQLGSLWDQSSSL